MKRTIPLILAAVMLAGCKATELTLADGTSFKRKTLLFADSVGELEAKRGTNEFRMKGFVSEAASTVGAVAEGFAKGMKSVK